MSTSAQLMDASCRVALAAYLHDLGKFAERAGLEVAPDVLEAHKAKYCPQHAATQGNQKSQPTHVHAAYTALAFDHIERHTPRLLQGDLAPFTDPGHSNADAGTGNDAQTTDSLASAAASHHRPETFLQWIIATADRLANGFGREAFDIYNAAREGNKETSTGRTHHQARLLSLVEQARTSGPQAEYTLRTLKWRYPLKALSPATIFPQPRRRLHRACECQRSIREPGQQRQSGALLGLQLARTCRRSRRCVCGFLESKVKTLSGSVRRLVISFSASWLPNSTKAGMLACMSRPISRTKKMPVL